MKKEIINLAISLLIVFNMIVLLIFTGLFLYNTSSGIFFLLLIVVYIIASVNLVFLLFIGRGIKKEHNLKYRILAKYMTERLLNEK